MTTISIEQLNSDQMKDVRDLVYDDASDRADDIIYEESDEIINTFRDDENNILMNNEFYVAGKHSGDGIPYTDYGDYNAEYRADGVNGLCFGIDMDMECELIVPDAGHIKVIPDHLWVFGNLRNVDTDSIVGRVYFGSKNFDGTYTDIGNTSDDDIDAIHINPEYRRMMESVLSKYFGMVDELEENIERFNVNLKSLEEDRDNIIDEQVDYLIENEIESVELDEDNDVIEVNYYN